MSEPSESRSKYKIKQLSIFLENKSGRLSKITNTLGKAGINIRAMSLADTSDFGIYRVVVNDAARAEKILNDNGLTVVVSEVLAVIVPDTPGALGELLEVLNRFSINIEYMYAFIQKGQDHAVVMLRFDSIDEAVDVITSNGFNLLTEKDTIGL